MCIMLSVIHFCCSSIPYIYGPLEGVHVPSVYMHSAICKTSLVQWYSIDLLSIGGGGLLYVHAAICETFWCGSIPYLYAQLEWGTFVLSICALCYMLNIFSIVVFHGSKVSWRGEPSVLSIHAFCQMLNIFGVVVFQTSMVNRVGCTSVLSICAFCYM